MDTEKYNGKKEPDPLTNEQVDSVLEKKTVLDSDDLNRILMQKAEALSKQYDQSIEESKKKASKKKDFLPKLKIFQKDKIKAGADSKKVRNTRTTIEDLEEYVAEKFPLPGQQHLDAYTEIPDMQNEAQESKEFDQNIRSTVDKTTEIKNGIKGKKLLNKKSDSRIGFGEKQTTSRSTTIDDLLNTDIEWEYKNLDYQTSKYRTSVQSNRSNQTSFKESQPPLKPLPVKKEEMGKAEFKKTEFPKANSKEEVEVSVEKLKHSPFLQAEDFRAKLLREDLNQVENFKAKSQNKRDTLVQNMQNSPFLQAEDFRAELLKEDLNQVENFKAKSQNKRDTLVQNMQNSPFLQAEDFRAELLKEDLNQIENFKAKSQNKRDTLVQNTKHSPFLQAEDFRAELLKEDLNQIESSKAKSQNKRDTLVQNTQSSPFSQAEDFRAELLKEDLNQVESSKAKSQDKRDTLVQNTQSSPFPRVEDFRAELLRKDLKQPEFLKQAQLKPELNPNQEQVLSLQEQQKSTQEEEIKVLEQIKEEAILKLQEVSRLKEATLVKEENAKLLKEKKQLLQSEIDILKDKIKELENGLHNLKQTKKRVPFWKNSNVPVYEDNSKEKGKFGENIGNSFSRWFQNRIEYIRHFEKKKIIMGIASSATVLVFFIGVIRFFSYGQGQRIFESSLNDIQSSGQVASDTVGNSLVAEGNSEEKSNLNTTQANHTVSTSNKKDIRPDVAAPNPLIQNENPEIMDLVHRYFQARLRRDIDQYHQLVKSEEEMTNEILEKTMDGIEDFRDISCYVKKGLLKDTYVVFVAYNTKFYNISTLAPSLTRFYIISDEDKVLHISHLNLSQDVEEYVGQVSQDQDVVGLTEGVNANFSKAVSEDKKLAKVIEFLSNPGAIREEGEPESIVEEVEEIEAGISE
ncbi:hypothetical protein FACS189418_2980 [Clostridia bacterium]|nr:hypothetical protein FACS189418_2980 [Clostridia bacterium]